MIKFTLPLFFAFLKPKYHQTMKTLPKRKPITNKLVTHRVTKDKSGITFSSMIKIKLDDKVVRQVRGD